METVVPQAIAFLRWFAWIALGVFVACVAVIALVILNQSDDDD